MTTVRALYEYNASEDNELTFKEGDIISTIGEPSEGWWSGTNNSTGLQGYFPENYVEIISKGPSTPAGNTNPRSSVNATDPNAMPRQDTFYQAPTINYDDMFAGVDDTGPKSHTVRGTAWDKERTYYTVSIGNTRKDKTMLGASSVLKYEIKSAIGTQVVYRSQDHFVWLHKRLCEKFPCIAIPPLPSKALTAKFEDDAIVGSRGVALETWLNRVLWHPVLRNATALSMFISQADEKGWKEDRKTCEKDKIINAQFYGSVATEGTIPENIDNILADFKKYIVCLDKAIKQVQAIKDVIVKRSHSIASDYKSMAIAISKINMVDEGFVWHAQSPDSQPLSAAFTKMTETYNGLAEQFIHNGNYNYQEVSRMLDEWLGYIRSYQDVLKIRDTAMSTYLATYQKFMKGGVQDDAAKATMSKIKRRTDIITAITAAESSEFHVQHLVNFKNIFWALCKNQAELHGRVNGAWADLQAAFEAVPSLDPQVNK